MVETIEEFADELCELREEIKEKGRTADAKLIASWLDRLVIALENLAPALCIQSEEIDQLAESDECPCCRGFEKKAAKKIKAKKTKPKKGKKKRK